MTIPLDNIKTRLQTQTFFSDSRRDQEKLKGIRQQANKIGLLRMAAKSFMAPKSSFVTVKESTIPVDPEIKYRDILSTTKTIFREEGFRGFVKGVVPRIIIQAPASAISWTAYEMIKKMLTTKRHYY